MQENVLEDVEKDIDVVGLENKRRSEPDGGVTASADLNAVIPQFADEFVSRRRRGRVKRHKSPFPADVLHLFRKYALQSGEPLHQSIAARRHEFEEILFLDRADDGF